MAKSRKEKKAEREEAERLAAAEQRLDAVRAARIEQINEEIKANDRRADSQRKIVEALEKEEQGSVKYEQAKQRQLELGIKHFELLEDTRTLTEAEEDALKKLRKRLEEQTKSVKKATEAQQKYNQGLGEGERIAKNYGQALFGLSGPFSDLYSKYIPKTMAELEGMGKAIFENVKSFQFVKDAAVKFMSETFNLAFAQDKAASAFQQATGAGNEFNNSLADIERAGAGAGVTMDEAGKATLSLFNSYRDFTNLSETEQKTIGTTVALMNELGVSTDTSAKIMDQATKSLGMTAAQSEETLRTLAATAKQIGKPMSEVAADFASVAPKLAFYGQDMINVFQKLEMQAKSTGLSVDQILGIVGEGFDTFEGAGEKVGRLNAIMGGPYLNSIDMLNASEEERLELIKQSIEASGTVFNDLNKFEQKAFAAALGTDVDSLRRSMGALSEEEEIRAMEQEQLNKLAADSKSIMDELKNAFRTLIVENRDFFESLKSLVTTFSDWLKGLDAGTKKMIFWGTIIGASVVKLANLYKALKTLQIIGGITKLWAGAIKVMKLWRAGWILTSTTMTATPWGAILAAIGIAVVLLIKHFKNMKEAGMSTADMIMDIGEKILLLMGPIGLIIAPLVSFIKHMVKGKSAGQAFVEMLKDMANHLTFGLAGKIFGFGTNIERATKTKGVKKVKDAVITNQGEVIEVDPADNIVAAQPGGALSKAMGGLGGAMVAGTPMGMMMKGAMRAMIGPILQETITDPVVRALKGTGTGEQPANINVIVKIGEKELNEQIITALNSPQGAAAISPFYQG